MDETAAAPTATPTGQIIVVGAKGRRTVDPLKVSIQPCDFRSPALLSEGDLRRLRNQQGEFARHFGAKVSAFLRLEFTLALAGVTTLPYARFTAALPDPAHLTLFRLDPLPGLGVINLPPAMGLAITNRMLGGRGTPPAAEGADRALTEIETSLLEDFVRMIAEEWCRLWPEPPDTRPLLVGYETNGKFLQTAPDDATMLVVSLDAVLGERTHTLQIAMPYATLEGNIKKSQPPRPRAVKTGVVTDVALIARRAAAAGISLPAVADWKVADVTLRDVLNLRAGDVLELPSETLTRTRINLTGQGLFVGTAGVRDGRVAVKLTGRVDDKPAASPESAAAPFAALLAQ